MKKKIVLSILFVILFLVIFAAWEFFGSATAFDGDKYYLYIRTGADYQQVLDSLNENKILKSVSFFKWIAKRFDYPTNVKAGKYEIKKGENLVSILRTL